MSTGDLAGRLAAAGERSPAFVNPDLESDPGFFFFETLTSILPGVELTDSVLSTKHLFTFTWFYLICPKSRLPSVPTTGTSRLYHTDELTTKKGQTAKFGGLGNIIP
jgi:hypothetical protein